MKITIDGLFLASARKSYRVRAQLDCLFENKRCSCGGHEIKLRKIALRPFLFSGK